MATELDATLPRPACPPPSSRLVGTRCMLRPLCATQSAFSVPAHFRDASRRVGQNSASARMRIHGPGLCWQGPEYGGAAPGVPGDFGFPTATKEHPRTTGETSTMRRSPARLCRARGRERPREARVGMTARGLASPTSGLSLQGRWARRCRRPKMGGHTPPAQCQSARLLSGRLTRAPSGFMLQCFIVKRTNLVPAVGGMRQTGSLFGRSSSNSPRAPALVPPNVLRNNSLHIPRLCSPTLRVVRHL